MMKIISLSVLMLVICARTHAEQLRTSASEYDQPFSLTDQPVKPEAVVILTSDHFAENPDAARARFIPVVHIVDGAYMKKLDGNEVPADVANALDRARRIVIPRIQFEGGSASDLCDMIVSALNAPQPDRTRSIGLIHQHDDAHSIKSAAHQSWHDDLNLDSVTVDIDARRVLLLDLIRNTASTLNVEVGLDPSGRVYFGRNGKWPVGSHPTYFVTFSDQ